MLKGTTRRPDDIVGKIPPDYADCTVEKAAINAVLAGCKPEYFRSSSQRLKPRSLQT